VYCLIIYSSLGTHPTFTTTKKYSSTSTLPTNATITTATAAAAAATSAASTICNYDSIILYYLLYIN